MAEASLVGRDREVSRLTGAIEDAREGRGSAWFLTGEPGIGKSRLAEEVGRLARERGMRTFWGRCWEAGGAPAYWPWVQILRAILRTAEPGQLDPFLGGLAQILPELRKTKAPLEAPELGPEQARFQLMDAVSNVLADAAQRCPLVLVLEDLHVADVSTILLLDFLAAAVRNQPVLVIGTFRDAELVNAPAGSQLMRAAQQGQQLSLERLTRDDVASFLATTGESVDASFVQALHRTTEGHPLFLVEVARLWKAQGTKAQGGPLSIPRSVRKAMQERIEGATPACSLTIRRGAVVGREFDIGLLEASYPDDSAAYFEGCQEATDAAVLIEVAPQRYRFVHFLLRELVYDAIPADERAEAHARLAEALQERPNKDGEPRWSEIAHHWSAVGTKAADQAADAYRRAGAQALGQLAFDEAVEAYRNAQRAFESSSRIDPKIRIELMVELGHAQTRAGDVKGGKATCAAAADLARELGDGKLLTRAALEHGVALIFAHVDPELVSLLEEALAALDETDSALRARVMARLAAAYQPAMDPEPPIQLAREAIAMARRIGDREVLLDTLRNGGSALVDLGDLEERVALDREHAALAEELNDPVEALRANMRSFNDYLALARTDDAFRTMHACERIADELGHPAYRWRCLALRVLRATWEGDFDQAYRLAEEVRALGDVAGDPNARLAYTYQKARILQLRGDFETQRSLVDDLDQAWKNTSLGEATADVLVGAEHLICGRTSEGLRRFHPESMDNLLRLGDPSLELSMARMCVAAEHNDLVERLYKRMMLTRENLVTTGVIGMTIEGPTSWGLALMARFLDRTEDAHDHYEHALAKARHAGGRPAQALIACEYAEMLAESEATPDRQRALELAEEAAAVAVELGMRAAEARANALKEQLAGVVSTTEGAPAVSQLHDLSMSRTGDSWLVRYGDAEFHLKDMKGVRLLAELVANPGREYHVLDLDVGSKAAPNPVDRGDAGEVLDEEARRQYQARVTVLREELEEAESWNDAGRAEKAREELEFLKQELASAVGLGGRERRVGAAAERARVNVQRRLRDAIRRIESHHPELAKHLDRAVRTGAYCAYEP